MKKNRIRCPECEDAFCSICNEEYHYKMTCKENREAKGLKKCRFCEKRRDPMQPNPTCASQTCINLGYQMCPKELECGHYCYFHGDNYG